MSLINKKCKNCEDKNAEALSAIEIETLLAEIPEWHANGKTIERNFTFKDFRRSMKFVNVVADVAEEENHHPDISIFYNRVKLSLSTHSVSDLTENDFIVAAKIDSRLNLVQLL